MVQENTTLASTIISETIFTLSEKQRSEMNVFISTMEKEYKAPAEIADKVCNYLQVPRFGNHQELVEIIMKFNRSKLL